MNNLPIPPSIIKKELKDLIASNADFVLLDVRTPSETADGKITPMAQEFDFHAEDFNANVLKLAPQKKYIVYCATGGRSGQAVAFMLQNGFKNVFNLAGGYAAYTKD